MTDVGQARDQLIGLFRTGWLANPTSATVPLEYDDVVADTSAAPTAATRRAPFGRVTVRNLTGTQDSIGSIGARRFLATCAMNVQVFTAPGDGNKKADALAKIALGIMRNLRDPNGVWFTGDAASNEIGIDEAGMFQTNVVANFNYQERA